MFTFAHMNPCIAIIDNNTLSSLSLKDILWDLYNHVEVHSYNCIDDFIKDSNRHFVHFLVSSEIVFNHPEEFETLREQTIVLMAGQSCSFEAAGYKTLNVSMTEEEIKISLAGLIALQQNRTYLNQESLKRTADSLSAREKEVLSLIVKGYINKEIAVKLNISLPTVIFHRNNICNKLQTRSIGRLTVYAILQGIVDMKEL